MSIEEVPPIRPRRAKPLFGKSRKFVRDKLHGRMFLVPSCITVVGIFCGFLAIINAIQGHFEYATKCIVLAIFLDGIDGRVARTLNATSAFGREFDSLADLVAFGVAPAVLTYCWAFQQTADEFGILVAFIFIVCGAARLARFNIMASEDPKPNFVGLPIPGAAAAIASLIYAFPDSLTNTFAVGFVCLYMTLIAALMVSTVPFFSLKRIKFTGDSQRLVLVIFLAVFVALTWKYSQAVFLLIGTTYALGGPAQAVLARMSGKKATEPARKIS